jgi:hypothetical protein
MELNAQRIFNVKCLLNTFKATHNLKFQEANVKIILKYRLFQSINFGDMKYSRMKVL